MLDNFDELGFDVKGFDLYGIDRNGLDKDGNEKFFSYETGDFVTIKKTT